MTETIANTRTSWIPFVSCVSKLQLLAECEKRIFSALGVNYVTKSIKIPFKDSEVHTVTVNSENNIQKFANPIVLIHGFGSGVALWGAVLKELAKFSTVHAFDLLGFGRSSRPTFSTDPKTAEEELVDSIEMWRDEMKIDKMNIVGHSFGGYLATPYAIKYPKRVDNLVLADPWGFNEIDPDRVPQLSRVQRGVFWTVMKFNPLSILRLAGSYGPNVMRRLRPDLKEKYSDAVYDYIYLCNTQKPTGETVFKSLTDRLAWAKDPMIRRFHGMDKNVPVTFIHGDRSWIDRRTSNKLMMELENVNMHVLENAGHHVYADNPLRFIEVVAESLEKSGKTETKL